MSQKGKSTATKIDSLTVKPSEAVDAINHMIDVNFGNAALGKNRRGLFLWGAPGIAKSSITKQVAASRNLKLIDIRLTQMEPTDLRGIPVPVGMNDASVEEVVVRWAIPALLPKRDNATGLASIEKDIITFDREVKAAEAAALLTDKPVVLPKKTYDGAIILLDELPNAAPSVQAGSYQLVLDGALGEYIVPDNVVVMAAGNRDTDKGSTFKMPLPLQNRFVHVELRSDFDDWQAFALSQGFNKDVVGFLTAFKHELYQFSANSASRGFATPRSWEAVSDILRDEGSLKEMVKLALIAGTVGDGIAVKFMEYQKNAAKLPNPSDILEGKIKELQTKEVSLMYALTTAMCYELRERYQATKVDTSKKKAFNGNVDNFLGFMMRQFQPEMVIMGARTMLAIFKIQFDPSGMKNWTEFSDDYQDLVLGA